MKIHQIKYFLTLSQERNFSLAAQKLNIGQSPLSRAIKELEDKLGVKLFIRHTRKMELTHAGRVLKKYATRILISVEAAKKATVAASQEGSWELRVALNDVIDVNPLSRFLSVARKDDPKLHIQLYEVSHHQCSAGLKEDVFDIGFTQHWFAEKGISCQKAWSDPFAVLLPKKHPLLRFEKIPLDELVKYPQIIFNSGHVKGFRKQVESCLVSSGVIPNIVEYPKVMNLLLTLVQTDFGVSLMGLTACKILQSEDITFRLLDSPSRMLDTFICYPELSISVQAKKVIRGIAVA